MKNDDWQYLTSLLLETELEEVRDQDTVFGPIGFDQKDSGATKHGEEPAPEHWGSGTRHYEALKRLASGGVGEVWEGVHPALSRKVALKRIREDVYARAQGPKESLQLEAIFRKEALITAALEHPNIVPVYDLGSDPAGRPALCMKLVDGKNWDKLIAEGIGRGFVEFLDQQIPILIAVSNAVAYAHSHGIVHRDLKPCQVMVGDFGEVLLADWGLAMVYDIHLFALTNPHLARLDLLPTSANAVNPSGTPAYMAPEQLDADAMNIGPWTDIFLLGGMLYQLLTGYTPHRTKGDLKQQARDCQIAPPKERTGLEVPEPLEELCMRALARDPAKRVASAKEFGEELQAYLTRVGKRRLSVSLTEEVAERLPNIKGNYEQLAECESILARASGLWILNKEAEPLRQKVLRDFAETAIEHEDLSLARLQASRLTDEALRQDLLNEINAHEQLGLLALEQAIQLEKEKHAEYRHKTELERLVCIAVKAALENEKPETFLREALHVLPHLSCSHETLQMVREAKRQLEAGSS